MGLSRFYLRTRARDGAVTTVNAPVMVWASRVNHPSPAGRGSTRGDLRIDSDLRGPQGTRPSRRTRYLRARLGGDFGFCYHRESIRSSSPLSESILRSVDPS